jgi:hypothetical protein
MTGEDTQRGILDSKAVLEDGWPRSTAYGTIYLYYITVNNGDTNALVVF